MGDIYNVLLIDYGNEYELWFNFNDGECDMFLFSYEVLMVFCLKIVWIVKGKDWCLSWVYL